MLSRKVSCRQSKLVLFIASNPFCNLQEILDKSGITKNWSDLKHDLNRLVEIRCIRKVNWWQGERYYFPLFSEPSLHTTSILLEVKNRIFSHIESNEPIRNNRVCLDFARQHKITNFTKIPRYKFEADDAYKLGLLPNKPLHEQVLEKFLNLYFFMTKFMLYEYKKNKRFGEAVAVRQKESREIKLLEFLRGFEAFLNKY